MATERQSAVDASHGDRSESTLDDSPAIDLYPGERDGSVESVRAERDFWRHLFDRLVEELPEAGFVVDDEGTLTHWNEAHEELSKLPAEDVVGRKANEVLGAEGETETLAEEIARVGESIREERIRTTTDPRGTPTTFGARAPP